MTPDGQSNTACLMRPDTFSPAPPRRAKPEQQPQQQQPARTPLNGTSCNLSSMLAAWGSPPTAEADASPTWVLASDPGIEAEGSPLPEPSRDGKWTFGKPEGRTCLASHCTRWRRNEVTPEGFLCPARATVEPDGDSRRAAEEEVREWCPAEERADEWEGWLPPQPGVACLPSEEVPANPEPEVPIGRQRLVKKLLKYVQKSLAEWRTKQVKRPDRDFVAGTDECEGAGTEECEGFDLMPLSPANLCQATPEELGLEEGPEALVDSGAEHPVANPRTHFPGSVVRPSAASKKGLVYRGPGKERIPNEGEIAEQLMTAEGVVSKTVWQAADVRRPLLAVSSCNDKGNIVVFDNNDSVILAAQSPEVAQIRALVRQAQLKVRLQRKGGTYVMRTWRMPKGGTTPARKPRAAGFARQGS